ncbi:sugar nucleotide-binding protein [Micromonospora sp. DR5-3]|uniref:sugar nucleotide-binding protein n=1 Tax=unclassified Micromonospora TaxID=2617518 RepID=UPI0011D8D291|nr:MULTISPECIES: sugar nucleotide-binding protein [unclassified Micromonospora]MCW3817163.1 sugar nucleotide-binding protein [Micromonospora sp. DR5-3]TYC21892.1 sugar nucleotide-binding protein [Micromonospora sp. MP36]
MTLLVVGASGFLGAEVCRQAVAAGQRVVGTYHSAAVGVAGVEPRRLDVTDRSTVRALLTEVRPDAVVATPYRYDDWTVTADGAAHVAYAAAEVGARLVHLSSDALHSGRLAPYLDDDVPTPIHAYGAAKAAAETAVRAIDPGAALVRTSLIVGEGSKQIQLCRDALAGRATLFTDELRCPIDVVDLAAAVLELVPSEYAGLLNVAGPDPVSRAELGLLVARRSGLDPAGLKTTTAVAAGVQRPTEVRLDSSRAAGLLRTRLRGVIELLAS